MKREPNWYGLNMLPVYDEMLDGQLDASIGQLRNLESAKHKPYVLNGEIISRILKAHNSQNEDAWVYFEQCQKWRDASPSTSELEVITRIEKNASRLEQVNKDIIELAKRFKENTIDAVLSKSDLEAGLDWLLKSQESEAQNN